MNDQEILPQEEKWIEKQKSILELKITNLKLFKKHDWVDGIAVWMLKESPIWQYRLKEKKKKISKMFEKIIDYHTCNWSPRREKE
jgi:hypothetical protein